MAFCRARPPAANGPRLFWSTAIAAWTTASAVTRRFAQEGFVCLSPDLFYGKTYHTLEDCALNKTSLDYSLRGAGHAFLNNPQGKSVANREAAAKSVVKNIKVAQEDSGLKIHFDSKEVHRGE